MIGARLDANQAEVVEALRAMPDGCFVQSLAMVGVGTPDLLVMYRGRIVLMEVKDGAKSPSERKLTPAEAKWHRMSAAVGVTVAVVESGEQAVAVMMGVQK